MTSMRKILFITLFILGVWQFFYAQESIFPKGSRVCFVGNSITNNGEFHHNILLYHLTRFPSTPVTFFNCGVSGCTTADIIKRIDSDILNLKPDYVVLMSGMNDVGRWLYRPCAINNADTLKMRNEMAFKYKNDVENTINILLKNNIKVILQTPTIYDQTVICNTPKGLGINDKLEEFAAFIKEMAAKYKLKVVDYWSIMNEINIREQKANPEFTLTSKDRVHPEATGHLVMAYQFLKSMGASSVISKMSVEKDLKKSQKLSSNCELISLKTTKVSVVFECKENALPFAIFPNQKTGVDLVDLNNNLNNEILTVRGLSSGNYNLFIDDIKIASFRSNELLRGVNIALYQQTPQYQQALLVKNELLKLRRLQGNLRSIKFIEYNSWFNQCEGNQNLAELKNCLTSVFKEKYPTNQYFQTQLDKYVELKPQEESIKSNIDILWATIYNLVIPKVHKFKIEKI